jgi:hypothetical protein
VLQEIFAERADPFVKILHLPSLRTSLISVNQNPRNASRELEALVFSFYLATISILGETECQSLLGVQKQFVQSRYALAARQALVNAQFLSTTSLVTLQAFALYLVCAILFATSGSMPCLD